MYKFKVGIVALLFLLSAPPTCTAVQYRVAPIGWLGPDYTEVSACDINGSGIIIGRGLSLTDGLRHSAVWDENGKIAPLEHLGGGCVARGINAAGTIVGDS